MVQADSRCTLTMDARIQSQAGLCEIRGEQSGTRTAVSPSTSVLPYQHHSTGAPQSFIYDRRHISAIDSEINTFKHISNSVKQLPEFAGILYIGISA
jgi:hypothetical protein